MKYMQVNVEYNYQGIHGLMTESIGLVVNPKLKGSEFLHEKVERFIKMKLCGKFSGKEFYGLFIKESKIISCSNQPVFDVE